MPGRAGRTVVGGIAGVAAERFPRLIPSGFMNGTPRFGRGPYARPSGGGALVSALLIGLV